MKSLTKLCIVVFLVLSGTHSFAQIFGVKAGLNLSNLLMKYGGETNNDLKMIPGFHIGPSVEFPINDMFSFESGLLFTTKGAMSSEKETYNGDSFEYKEKVTLLYFDIPLTAKVSFDIGNSKAYGILGP